MSLSRAGPAAARPVARLLALERRHAELDFAGIRERILRGEADAWSVFVERYSRTIYTLALRLGPGGAEREEVAQAVYLGVLDRLARGDCRLLREFREEARFETYLFAAIRNEVARSRRKRALERERTVQPGADEAAAPPGRGGVAERIGLDPARVARLLEDCLARLEPRERLVLQLRFRDGVTYRRLAELFEWKDTNAAVYEVTRILRKLELLDRCRRSLGWGEPERETLCSGLRGWLDAENAREQERG
jgi:RNA polymerase sigma-70 factor (ECF subfamily)